MCVVGTTFWSLCFTCYACFKLEDDHFSKDIRAQKKWKVIRDCVLIRNCALYWQEVTVKRSCQPGSDFYHKNFQDLQEILAEIQKNHKQKVEIKFEKKMHIHRG